MEPKSKPVFIEQVEGPCECDYCDERFPGIEDKRNHVFIHHNGKKKEFDKNYKIFSCPIEFCFKKFYTFVTMNAHCNKFHKQSARHFPHYTHMKPEQVYCTLCDKSYYRKGFLEDHMKTHNPEFGQISTLYQCYICSNKFTHKRYLARHLRFGSDSDSTLCVHCGKSFENQCVLKRHRKACKVRMKEQYQSRIKQQHQSSIIRKCLYCDMEFTSNKLSTHMLNDHDHNAEFCEICGKKCYGLPKLKKHLEVHNEGLPYQCNYCGKKFKTEHNLSVHTVSLHETDKCKFECEQCGKRFRLRNTLKDHMNGHLGLKPYECEFCGTGFQNQSNLLSHQKKTSCKDRKLLH